MAELLLHFIIAMLYAVLAAQAWLGSRWALAGAQTEAASPRWPKAALPAALVLHAWLLYRTLFADDGIHLSLANALSLIAWLTATIYWAASLRTPLEALQGYILPVACLSSILPLLSGEGKAIQYSGWAFKAHLIVALCGYGLLTVGALHALLMSTMDRRLHHGGQAGLPPRGLPPLMMMETLLFRVIGAGFVLLTLTVLSGALFSETVFGQPFQFTHKVVFSILAWVVFAVLLSGRHFHGWRGRTAVRWTLSGYVLLLLGYVGTKLVFELKGAASVS